MTGGDCQYCGLPLVQTASGMWLHAEDGDCGLPMPSDAVICYPPGGEDAPIEGRVLDEGEAGYFVAGMAQSADHWPAFQPVKLAWASGNVWHDEATRLEERGRLDEGPCECGECS